MTLSIIIPVFNEKNTVLALLKKVVDIDLGDIKKEIVLIDDGSTDGTKEILKTLEGQHKIIYHEKNQGKGAAVRTGFKNASGDLVLIQDADLEYDPQNYRNLMKPILDGKADVVFGSRFLNPQFRHVSKLSHLANIVLTGFSNLLTGLKLTDMWTCHKIFKKEVVDAILPELTGNRFEIEPEMTALIAKKKFRVVEVPLSVLGTFRTIKEGKKVRMKDGVVSIWYMIKFNLLR